jgi:hypothetical protein
VAFLGIGKVVLGEILLGGIIVGVLLGGLPLLLCWLNPNGPWLLSALVFALGFAIGAVGEVFFGFEANFGDDGIRVASISSARHFPVGTGVTIECQFKDSIHGKITFSESGQSTSVYFRRRSHEDSFQIALAY